MGAACDWGNLDVKFGASVAKVLAVRCSVVWCKLLDVRGRVLIVNADSGALCCRWHYWASVVRSRRRAVASYDQLQLLLSKPAVTSGMHVLLSYRVWCYSVHSFMWQSCECWMCCLEYVRQEQTVMSLEHVGKFLAICYRPSVVCLSVVCNACAPYSGGSNFRQYFYGIRYLGHPLTSTENFTQIVPGEPLRRGS